MPPQSGSMQRLKRFKDGSSPSSASVTSGAMAAAAVTRSMEARFMLQQWLAQSSLKGLSLRDSLVDFGGSRASGLLDRACRFGAISKVGNVLRASSSTMSVALSWVWSKLGGPTSSADRSLF